MSERFEPADLKVGDDVGFEGRTDAEVIATSREEVSVRHKGGPLRTYKHKYGVCDGTGVMPIITRVERDGKVIFPKPEPDPKISVSVDLGSGKDQSVVVIVEHVGDKASVLHAGILKPYVAPVEEVASILSEWEGSGEQLQAMKVCDRFYLIPKGKP